MSWLWQPHWLLGLGNSKKKHLNVFLAPRMLNVFRSGLNLLVRSISCRSFCCRLSASELAALSFLFSLALTNTIFAVWLTTFSLAAFVLLQSFFSFFFNYLSTWFANAQLTLKPCSVVGCLLQANVYIDSALPDALMLALTSLLYSLVLRYTLHVGEFENGR